MAQQRDRDKSRLMDAIHEAEHCAYDVERMQVKPHQTDSRELYLLNKGYTVEHLLDALQELGVRIQGRPKEDEMTKAFEDERPLRLICSILPQGK
jgi:hypothetical protein